LAQSFLREHLRSRIRRQRTDLRVLCPWAVLRGAIDAATGREDEGTHASTLGEPRQPYTGLVIDVEGDLLISLTHGVIRDGRQMYDGIDVVQKIGLDPPYVGVVLSVELRLGTRSARRETVGEEAHVDADEFCVGEPRAELTRDPRSHVPEIAGDQYFHRLSS